MSKLRLESERLIIRQFVLSDQDAFVAHRLDEKMSKYIVLGQTKSQVLDRFAQILDTWAGNEGEKLALAIEYKADGQYVGDLMLKYLSIDERTAEIGYSLKAQYHKKGIAVEAAKLLIEYAFKELSMAKIVAFCDTRNIASFKLMEKLGMHREQLLLKDSKIADQWFDSYRYAIAKEDWQLLQIKTINEAAVE